MIVVYDTVSTKREKISTKWIRESYIHIQYFETAHLLTVGFFPNLCCQKMNQKAQERQIQKIGAEMKVL